MRYEDSGCEFSISATIDMKVTCCRKTISLLQNNSCMTCIAISHQGASLLVSSYGIHLCVPVCLTDIVSNGHSVEEYVVHMFSSLEIFDK